MLYYVRSSLIYNSQKLESTQMPLNRGMDTENVIHLHNGVLRSYNNNKFMKFLGKWMDLEDIILSEVTQSQKNTHGMHSLKWILAQKLRIPNIQFIDHLKVKNKEDQSVDTSFLRRSGNKNTRGRSYRVKVQN